ncbi:MAG TPA: hypothetical protein VGL29_05765 [Blastocatellia bacterium]
MRPGNNDRAIEQLELAYKAHVHPMTGLTISAVFDGFHSDPRFHELLRRMKLDN